MSDTVEIKVSQDLIKPILETKIKTALIEAIGGIPQLTDHMVETYLNQKCDSEGKSNKNDYYDKFKRVDWLLQNLIAEAMREALKEYMENNKQILAKAISRYMSSKKGSAAIVDAINKGLVESMLSQWKFQLNVLLPKD